MEKLNLTINDILSKEFAVEFKGYSAIEVDTLLDQIIEDYRIFDANVKELLDIIDELRKQLDEQKEELNKANSKIEYLDLSNTTSYSSIDLLKRVSRLEEVILKK